jgi:hypothetical protein
MHLNLDQHGIPEDAIIKTPIYLIAQGPEVVQTDSRFGPNVKMI